MSRKTKAEREMDILIDATYRKYGGGVQIDIMDIPKIFALGRKAILERQNLDQAIKDAIAMFRKN